MMLSGSSGKSARLRERSRLSTVGLLDASLSAIHVLRSLVQWTHHRGSTSRSTEPEHIEAQNTYGLPEGEPIALALRRWFRKQHRVVLASIPMDGSPLPMHLPRLQSREWIDPMANEMVPLLRPYWSRAYRESSSRLSRHRDLVDIGVALNPYLRSQIEKQSFTFCRSTNESTSRRLEEALEALKLEFVHGLVERGETAQELAKRVNKIFDGLTERQAYTIAVTEASRAHHAAQVEAARESGVVAGKELLISADACELCQMVATEVKMVRLDQPFAIIGDHAEYSTVMYPPLHPNCFLPETPIRAPGRVAGIEAHYYGPVVRINLAQGGEITVTPNHLFLTNEGFVSASRLMKGDYLVCYGGPDGPLSGAPDYDGKPTPIKEIVAAFAVSDGVASYHVPVAPEHIHGDGRFCEGEVHVVAADSLLGHGGDPLRIKKSGEDRFIITGGRGIGFYESGDLLSVLIGLRDPADGPMGWISQLAPLLRAKFRHPEGISLRSASHFDSGRLKPTIDDGSGDSIGLRKFIRRFPSKITTDKILDIDHKSFHYNGPVYDVETVSSLYTVGASNAIVHNCRCSMIDVLFPEYGGPAEPDWGLTIFHPEDEIRDLEGEYEPPRGLKVPEPEPERLHED